MRAAAEEMEQAADLAAARDGVRQAGDAISFT